MVVTKFADRVCDALSRGSSSTEDFSLPFQMWLQQISGKEILRNRRIIIIAILHIHGVLPGQYR